MKVHVLQHVPFEDTGSMALWLQRQGARVSYTRFFEGDSLPAVQGLDLVIAMGGPMSVNDEAALPWLRDEKAFIRDVIQRNIPILGVCLGAQLIASASGARVYPNPFKEIGWFPVTASPSRGADSFCFPAVSTVFHWHGETFDLPAGAIPLAENKACVNQAFQLGRRAIGLQFHLETTPEGMEAILGHCAGEMAPGPYVQTPAHLRAATPKMYAVVNGLMDSVLDYLTGV